MKGATTMTVGAVKYELEIPIDAPCARVWKAILEEPQSWWLPDFHMTGPGSVVEFDARAGGHFLERHADGGGLLWFTIHMIRPSDFTIYLVGNLAPDWGGPATSMLKWSIEPRGPGSVLKVSDAIVGHIDEDNVRSLREGWTHLLRDGLKAHVERR